MGSLEDIAPFLSLQKARANGATSFSGKPPGLEQILGLALARFQGNSNLTRVPISPNFGRVPWDPGYFRGI